MCDNPLMYFIPEGLVPVQEESTGHTPVLTKEVCELLNVQPGEIVVDATVGLAGHARLFAEAVGPEGMLIGLDVDPANLDLARKVLADFPCPIKLFHANFCDIQEIFKELDLDRVDIIFADLGVSSTQLDQFERGFSFREDGPLDMRMNPNLKTTATDLVNTLKERELADLIFYNSQEHASRRIAKRICQYRREGRITTTLQLSSIVAGALGVNPNSRKNKIHPATRTFLALRIAVNREIHCLETLLDQVPALLRPGGRFGVIAFHSVEDKPVKLNFRQQKNERKYQIMTKKPIVACDEERVSNPRSRSAKLRVAIRLPEPDVTDDASGYGL